MLHELPVPPEPGLNLALAVVESSNTPLLLLDDTFTVIAASRSFSRTFDIDHAGLAGCKLLQLGHGEWNVCQLASLLNATAADQAQIDAYEMDLLRQHGQARHLVINSQKLDYGRSGPTRLLLAVLDVTEAKDAERLKEAMLRELADMRRDKAVLLNELQHRVANSLQIIASVLLQSARRVQSDETRSHLHEAHQRVMSVAAMQRQLAASSTDDVFLRSYFTDLCASLGASMIRNREQLSLEVDTDESVISADISISLGLVVTELVINALKHAFPGDRHGKIMVGYHAQGRDWVLSVCDDGVGMAKTPETLKPRLGTSIITALARQLDAEIHVVATHPGTAITLSHTEAPDTHAKPTRAV